MTWLLFFEILYIILILLVCVRIILDTRSTTKTLAYVLMVIFLPIAGILIYFSFGVNYRKRKIYNKNIFDDIDFEKKLGRFIRFKSKEIIDGDSLEIIKFNKLAKLVLNQSLSPITTGNEVKLLLNGENKFPEVFSALEAAKNHIHIEYYIYEDDRIGRKIIDLLIKKSNEGVKVRFIYDDFGSRSIRKTQVARLKEAGIEAFPFYKIKLIYLANRLNYRNHRKIIVVDGATGFVGGINVSDKYINSGGDLFWRDTHLRLEGPAVSSLQYIFMGDWNYCSSQTLEADIDFFPFPEKTEPRGKKIVQIAFSGPDSDSPLIQHSIAQTISSAKEEVLITTPYFIPGESLIDALLIASWSGVKVKILVPEKSDSNLVNFAARSNYKLLLNAGVEIYTYYKGFVHAKTLVADKQLAMVGTANMDIRSFDLNFEVNALIYNTETAIELSHAFYEDLKYANKIDPLAWKNRSMGIQLLEKIAGLLSPML